MPILCMLRGLPASGKTTLALQMVREEGYRRVNRDDLRVMIDDGFYTHENEKLIKAARDCIIAAGLQAGYDVVVDDTNLKVSDESDLRYIALIERAEFRLIFMDTPLEECVLRDSVREHPIGEQVIRSMYDQYIVKDES